MRAFDPAYNVSPQSNVFSITLGDTLPPDAPTGLISAGFANEVYLFWDPATDNVAVAGYDVLRDGSPIASATDTSFLDDTVSEDTTYSYTVRAFDAAGNLGPESNPLVVTTPSLPPPPPGPVEVEVLGAWQSGLSHPAETGSDRALVFTAHVDDNDAVPNLESVSYGGQPLTKVVEQSEGSQGYAYAAAYVLDEAGIAAASDSSFVVSWAESPDHVAYASAFLGNVDQALLVGASDGVGASSKGPLTTSPLPAGPGDLVVSTGTCANPGVYTLGNAFAEAIELSITSADGVVGTKLSGGGTETVSITHSSSKAQVALGFVVEASPADEPPLPPSGVYCGLGIELAPLLALLGVCRARRGVRC